jgi:hypothetical protein
LLFRFSTFFLFLQPFLSFPSSSSSLGSFVILFSRHFLFRPPDFFFPFCSPSCCFSSALSPSSMHFFLFPTYSVSSTSSICSLPSVPSVLLLVTSRPTASSKATLLQNCHEGSKMIRGDNYLEFILKSPRDEPFCFSFK